MEMGQFCSEFTPTPRIREQQQASLLPRFLDERPNDRDFVQG